MAGLHYFIPSDCFWPGTAGSGGKGPYVLYSSGPFDSVQLLYFDYDLHFHGSVFWSTSGFGRGYELGEVHRKNLPVYGVFSFGRGAGSGSASAGNLCAADNSIWRCEFSENLQ